MPIRRRFAAQPRALLARRRSAVASHCRLFSSSTLDCLATRNVFATVIACRLRAVGEAASVLVPRLLQSRRRAGSCRRCFARRPLTSDVTRNAFIAGGFFCRPRRLRQRRRRRHICSASRCVDAISKGNAAGRCATLRFLIFFFSLPSARCLLTMRFPIRVCRASAAPRVRQPHTATICHGRGDMRDTGEKFCFSPPRERSLLPVYFAYDMEAEIFSRRFSISLMPALVVSEP